MTGPSHEQEPDSGLAGAAAGMSAAGGMAPAEAAKYVLSRQPAEKLFEGMSWRVSPEPLALDARLASDLEGMGRVLLKFYNAANLLYRSSVEGKQPAWVAEWLERGKPQEIIDLQRNQAFRAAAPAVIRPDVLLTEKGLTIVELDSVPGGIGVTSWLNQVYSELKHPVLGGADGMLRGFAGIFGGAKDIHIVVSEESKTYAPEMRWLANQLAALSSDRSYTVSGTDLDPAPGSAVYRFFELFDHKNVANFARLAELAGEKQIHLTPPLKFVFEEKMLLGLLWNRNLHDFWRQNLGDSFLKKMKEWVPYTWVMDTAEMPPHAAIPELGITDWKQLKSLSQRDRSLVLKISGFSESAWGSRSVSIGSDQSQAEWSEAVDRALDSARTNPYVLMRYQKPASHSASWYNETSGEMESMNGRVRLCPYFFLDNVHAEQARAPLGGVLATICPDDKKIIHGMTDAILTAASVKT